MIEETRPADLNFYHLCLLPDSCVISPEINLRANDEVHYLQCLAAGIEHVGVYVK